MMKTFNKFTILQLSLLVALSGYVKETRSLTDDQKFGIAVGVGVAAVAGVAYLVYREANSEAAHQRKIDAASLSRASSVSYLTHFDILDKELNISEKLVFNDARVRIIIDSVNEILLQNLEKQVNRINVSDYLYGLNKLISDLRKHKEILTCSKDKLIKKYEWLTTYQKAIEALNNVNDILPKLEFLHSYVSNHKSYFDLSKTVKNIESSYTEDLKTFERCKANENECAKNLKKAARPFYVKSNHPLSDYVDNLSISIDQLNNRLKDLRYRYGLENNAAFIKGRIESIRSLIVNDPEYIKEKKDKAAQIQKDKELKQKREIEEKKLALERQKAQDAKDLKERELNLKAVEVAGNLNQGQQKIDQNQQKIDMQKAATQKPENNSNEFNLNLSDPFADFRRVIAESKREADERARAEAARRPAMNPAHVNPAPPAYTPSAGYENMYPNFQRPSAPPAAARDVNINIIIPDTSEA